MNATSRALLSPATTGALLLVLARGPARLRAALRQRVPAAALARLLRALAALFALGLLARANALLSAWAKNRWQVPGRGRRRRWADEVAVVTGGCGGIGAAVARGLLGLGCKVVVVDTVPLPESLGDWANLTYEHCDITSPDSVHQAADRIRAQLGAPSILINNAGLARPAPILSQTAAALQAVFATNLLAHWTLLQAFVPDMVAAGAGHVVGVASLAAFVTPAGFADYAASKAGVVSLHEALAQELKHRYACPRVRSSVVCPTYVRTPFVEPYREGLRKAKALTLAPRDVADAVVAQVREGRCGVVVLPERYGWLAGLRGWPAWVQEFIRDGTREHVTGKSE
ncbi:hypothetical protein BDY21DRAFT_283528 [Lineolata rhizophorae]|uniref:Ketoreductase domain-containing protein n=1 Tax=Lineolata rhizophorae TaxID=578093 RepID=A0A6A6P591_9PEZI|nr:hypothetical protein BDY21DRAFT_283528 [Lineolata rhizophorae]